MKLLYALALLAALGLVLSPAGRAGDKQEPKDKGDKKEPEKKGEVKSSPGKGDDMDGVWTLVEVIEAGKKSTDLKLQMVIKGTTFTLETGGKSTKGTFKADPSKSPKQVTAYFDDGLGNKIQIDSIYELKDDTMRVCGGLGKVRPKEFSSTAENGYELVTYKRAKK